MRSTNIGALFNLLQNLSKTPNKPKLLIAIDAAIATTAPSLDSTASVLLIRGLGQSNKLTRAKDVLSGLAIRNKIPSIFLYSIVLQCLIPLGSIRDVEKVWDDFKASVEVGRKDKPFGFKDFVIGICRYGRDDGYEIEHVYERIQASRWGFSREEGGALVGAFCRTGGRRLDLAWNVLREMEEKGMEADELSYFALFRSFCDVGDVAGADSVLRCMVERWNCELDLLIYQTFLYGLCKAGKLREAHKLFDKMTRRGNNLKEGSIPLVFKKRRRVIFQLNTDEMISETTLFEVYFRSLCLTGRVEEAVILLNEAKEKKIKMESCVYSLFIEALFKTGRDEDAFKFFELYRKKSSRCIGEIGSSMIQGLCKTGKVDDAYKLLLEIVEMGIVLTVSTWNLILKRYWNDGRLQDAMDIFDAMRNGNFSKHAMPDSATYSVMICGFIDKGHIDMAIYLIDEMAKKKLKVDFDLHKVILQNLYSLGKLHDVQKYLNKMIEEGITPSYTGWELLLESVIEEPYNIFR